MSESWFRDWWEQAIVSDPMPEREIGTYGFSADIADDGAEYLTMVAALDDGSIYLYPPVRLA